MRSVKMMKNEFIDRTFNKIKMILLNEGIDVEGEESYEDENDELVKTKRETPFNTSWRDIVNIAYQKINDVEISDNIEKEIIEKPREVKHKNDRILIYYYSNKKRGENWVDIGITSPKYDIANKELTELGRKDVALLHLNNIDEYNRILDKCREIANMGLTEDSSKYRDDMDKLLAIRKYNERPSELVRQINPKTASMRNKSIIKPFDVQNLDDIILKLTYPILNAFNFDDIRVYKNNVIREQQNKITKEIVLKDLVTPVKVIDKRTYRKHEYDGTLTQSYRLDIIMQNVMNENRDTKVDLVVNNTLRFINENGNTEELRKQNIEINFSNSKRGIVENIIEDKIWKDKYTAECEKWGRLYNALNLYSNWLDTLIRANKYIIEEFEDTYRIKINPLYSEKTPEEIINNIDSGIEELNIEREVEEEKYRKSLENKTPLLSQLPVRNAPKVIKQDDNQKNFDRILNFVLRNDKEGFEKKFEEFPYESKVYIKNKLDDKELKKWGKSYYITQKDINDYLDIMERYTPEEESIQESAGLKGKVLDDSFLLMPSIMRGENGVEEFIEIFKNFQIEEKLELFDYFKNRLKVKESEIYVKIMEDIINEENVNESENIEITESQIKQIISNIDKKIKGGI